VVKRKETPVVTESSVVVTASVVQASLIAVQELVTDVQLTAAFAVSAYEL